MHVALRTHGSHSRVHISRVTRWGADFSPIKLALTSWCLFVSGSARSPAAAVHLVSRDPVNLMTLLAPRYHAALNGNLPPKSNKKTTHKCAVVQGAKGTHFLTKVFWVSWGLLFKGLGVQKDTQTPCWLRPCMKWMSDFPYNNNNNNNNNNNK